MMGAAPGIGLLTPNAQTAAQQIINDRYQLLEVAGRGATAVVWSAWDTALQRVVALKLIPRSAKLPTTGFEVEARLICKLEHPHIVPLYDYGISAENYFLVTRYVTGGTLADRLMHGPLAPQEALACLSRIALALDYVHSQNIVHRDLKPGNVLLDAQGMPYLADFGLAKPITMPEQEVSISGTWNYMAPEQMSGRASTASDVFAFGVMLYQILTGALPLNGAHSLGMMLLGGDHWLPNVLQADPTLPVAINDLLIELTHVDPSARPPLVYPLIQKLEKDWEPGGASVATASATRTTHSGIPLDAETYEAQALFDRVEQASSASNASSGHHGSSGSDGMTTIKLTLTDYLMLDVYLQAHPRAVSAAMATTMLETALQYERGVDRWGRAWLVGSPGLPVRRRIELTLRLIGQALFHSLPEARSLLLWCVVGSALAFALQLYSVITPNPVTDDIRFLNAVGNGILFGLPLGAGLCVGIHMARRLRAFPYFAGIGLGWLVSSVLIAATFGLFQRLFYLDELDPLVAFGAALLYSGGFVWTASGPALLQAWAGAAGVTAAYSVPYLLYISEQIERAPFIFRFEDPTYGIPLAFLCALIVAACVTGPRLVRLVLAKRPEPRP